MKNVVYFFRAHCINRIITMPPGIKNMVSSMSQAICHMYFMASQWPVAPLQWCHYECDGVSKHQRHECLLNRFFRRKSKKTSKLRATGLCEVNPPVTGGFPAQRVSNAEMFLFDDVIMRCSEKQHVRHSYALLALWAPATELLPPPHKGPIMREIYPCHVIIMVSTTLDYPCSQHHIDI